MRVARGDAVQIGRSAHAEAEHAHFTQPLGAVPVIAQSGEGVGGLLISPCLRKPRGEGVEGLPRGVGLLDAVPVAVQGVKRGDGLAVLLASQSALAAS